MPISKPIKRNFYNGGSQEIEMPPLDETPPIAQADDPWSNQQSAPQGRSQAFENVPDDLPEDVASEMGESYHESPEHQEVEVEEQDQEEEQPEKVQKYSSKGPQESFKAIREAKDRAERERDALMAQIIEMQKQSPKYQEKPQPQYQPEPEEEDFEFNVDDADLIEGKHAKKIVSQMKKMQSQLKQYQNQSYQTSIEAKIKANFPDFEQVVSVDNVEILNHEFPELAQSLRDTSDMYNKAAAAYSVIKRTGIYKDKSEFMKERQKAVDNSKKPRPVASVSPQQGDSPLSRANAFANGLTPELQRQLREEMAKSRRSN